MIVESLTSLGFFVIEWIFSGLQIISLPTDLLGVLVDYLRIGAWIIGADLLSICFATFFAFTSFKLSAGLIVYVWKLLPLT